LCRKAGLQSSDARDVVQEVFQSLVSSIDQFQKNDPRASFRGWLWTITRNKIRDHYRQTSKEPRAAGGDHTMMQQLPDVKLAGARFRCALRFSAKRPLESLSGFPWFSPW